MMAGPQLKRTGAALARALGIACRTMLRTAAVLVVATALTGCARSPVAAAIERGDEVAVRQTLIDWYAAYAGTDEARYRSFVTDDYVLLENGDPMNIEDDVKAMRARPSGYGRKDAFDFKSVRLDGVVAYAWYFLESEIRDDTKIQRRRWLESAVLRRLDGRWRVVLLHSTKISGTDTPRQ